MTLGSSCQCWAGTNEWDKKGIQSPLRLRLWVCRVHASLKQCIRLKRRHSFQTELYLFFNKRLAFQFIIQDTMFLIIVYFCKIRLHQLITLLISCTFSAHHLYTVWCKLQASETSVLLFCSSGRRCPFLCCLCFFCLCGMNVHVRVLLGFLNTPFLFWTAYK